MTVILAVIFISVCAVMAALHLKMYRAKYILILLLTELVEILYVFERNSINKIVHKIIRFLSENIIKKNERRNSALI